MRLKSRVIAIAKSRIFRWTAGILVLVIVLHHVYVYIATARIKHEIAPPPKTVNDPTEGLVTIDQIAAAMTVEEADYNNVDLPYFGEDDECCAEQPLTEAQRTVCSTHRMPERLKEDATEPSSRFFSTTRFVARRSPDSKCPTVGAGVMPPTSASMANAARFNT